MPIGYIREMVEHPRPASRLDVEPEDAGVAGAKMAIDENNAGGRFLGDFYSLDASTVASPEEAVEALQKLYDSGHRYFIVDASADDPAQARRLRPRTRTFSFSTSAPPTFRSGRRIAAPMSCMSCPTATCWPTRSPNIS